MDWDNCNHKKLNQFKAEAKRWQNQEPAANAQSKKKNARTQPPKRKKKKR